MTDNIYIFGTLKSAYPNTEVVSADDVYIGEGSDRDSIKNYISSTLATKDFVIAESNRGLSNYYTKSAIDGKQFITSGSLSSTLQNYVSYNRFQIVEGNLLRTIAAIGTTFEVSSDCPEIVAKNSQRDVNVSVQFFVPGNTEEKYSEYSFTVGTTNGIVDITSYANVHSNGVTIDAPIGSFVFEDDTVFILTAAREEEEYKKFIHIRAVDPIYIDITREYEERDTPYFSNSVFGNYYITQYGDFEDEDNCDITVKIPIDRTTNSVDRLVIKIDGISTKLPLQEDIAMINDKEYRVYKTEKPIVGSAALDIDSIDIVRFAPPKGVVWSGESGDSSITPGDPDISHPSVINVTLNTQGMGTVKYGKDTVFVKNSTVSFRYADTASFTIIPSKGMIVKRVTFGDDVLFSGSDNELMIPITMVGMQSNKTLTVVFDTPDSGLSPMI